MNTDQYPKTLTAATDVLANHKPDVKLSYQNKKFKSTEVKNEQIVETSFVQEQKGHHFQCNCCGKKGHPCAICWKRDTTKQEDWWINKQKNKQSGQYPNKKGKSFHQKKSKNDSDNSDDDDDSDDSGGSVSSYKSNKSTGSKARGRSSTTARHTRSKSKPGMSGFQGFVKPKLTDWEAEFDKLVGKQVSSKDPMRKFNGLK